jgi:hypothetical protein
MAPSIPCACGVGSVLGRGEATGKAEVPQRPPVCSLRCVTRATKRQLTAHCPPCHLPVPVPSVRQLFS